MSLTVNKKSKNLKSSKKPDEHKWTKKFRKKSKGSKISKSFF